MRDNYHCSLSLPVFICLSLLLACCSAAEEQTTFKTYFNVDSLIDQQIEQISEMKPTAIKYGVLGNEIDTVTVELTDSATLANELDIFRQMNLVNKPVNRSSYSLKDGIRNPNSNLLMMEFTTEEELPLEFLRIYYLGDLSKVRKLEAKYTEKNALYTSSRFLTLMLKDVYSKTIVSTYSVEGGQKMFLGDSVAFKLQTILKYP